MDKLNPIISLVLAVLLGIVGWFMQTNYQQLKDAQKGLYERLSAIKDDTAKKDIDFEKRLTLLEYMVRSKNGRYQ